MLNFISIIVALIAFSVLYKRYLDRFSTNSIDYSVSVERGEVFEGDHFILREFVTNVSIFPVSAIRIDLNLPDGLEFELDDGRRVTSVSGLYTMKSRETVTRTWRIFARHRGNYTVNRAIIIKRSLFGLEKTSERIELSSCAENSVVVYPEIIDIRGYFTTDKMVTGNALSRARLVRDPLITNGVRAYTPDDPMNRVNWKVSASHGALYVNNEEFTERYDLDVLLNMQSRSREKDKATTAYPEKTDLCVNLTAAIIDKCTSDSIPVSLITNGATQIPSLLAEMVFVEEDSFFSVYPTVKDRDDSFSLLCELAMTENAVSVPTFDMLEVIAQAPELYIRGKNLVVITSYLDTFILKFHESLSKKGYSLVYYVTSAEKELVEFPLDTEIHYKTKKVEAYYE